MTSFSKLIEATQRKLSQSAGVAVQKYAQPRIADYLQDSFDSFFLLHFWPQFMKWETITLDGMTGTPVADPSVTRFQDFRAMFITDTNRRIRQTPGSFNPNLINSGDMPLYVEGQTGSRVLQFWPKTATQTIEAHGRVKPDDFGLNDDVDFDRLLLTTHAAWKYTVDDGTNPGQAEKFKQELNTHLTLLEAALQQLPYELDPRLTRIPGTWAETD